MRYSCDECDKTYSKPYNLKRHQSDHHENKVHVECDICQKKFMKLQSLNKHKTNAHQAIDRELFTCPHCQKELYSSKTLKTHIDFFHGEEQKYKCEKCGKAFGHKSSLIYHDNAVHLKVKYDCDQCEKSFSFLSNLKNHFQAIHGKPREPRFSCELCGKKFLYSANVSSHIREIHNKERINCTLCDKSFTQSGSLKRHEQTEHDNIRWICETCEKPFMSQAQLTVHNKKIHLKTFVEEKVKCDQCDVLCSKGSLERHIEGVHNKKTFDCKLCPKKYTQLGSLGRHVETTHSDKTFDCGVCGKPFKSEERRKGHEKQVHTIHEKSTCEKCGKVFTKKSLMKDHVSRVHFGKRVNCEICSKEIFKENYRKHLLIHNEVGNYVNCPKCGKSIFFKNLRKHIRELHETDSKDWRCDVCGNVFKYKRTMLKHVTSFHQNEKSIEGLEVKSETNTFEPTQNLSKCEMCHQSMPDSKLKDHFDSIHLDKMIECEPCKKKFPPRAYKRHVYSAHEKVKKTHECEECGKIYSTSKQLEIHTTSVHQNIKFTCGLCSVECASRRNLQKHKNSVHFVESAVQCPKCDKSYKHSASLSNHMALAHSDKSYQCEICQKMFYLKSQLNSHLQLKHGNKVDCPKCLKSYQPYSIGKHVCISEDMSKSTNLDMLLNGFI